MTQTYAMNCVIKKKGRAERTLLFALSVFVTLRIIVAVLALLAFFPAGALKKRKKAVSVIMKYRL